jgi:hypothetical protein
MYYLIADDKEEEMPLRSSQAIEGGLKLKVRFRLSLHSSRRMLLLNTLPLTSTNPLAAMGHSV